MVAIVVGVLFCVAGVLVLVRPTAVARMERGAPRAMQNYGLRAMWRGHDHARLRFLGVGLLAIGIVCLVVQTS